VGAVVEVPEAQIDALSTISGSGPAYVFLLIEQFTAAAREMGFADADARLLAEQTFIGATALLDSTGEDPAELRRRVTSPKGTTERAVAVLQDAHLSDTFAAAAAAALARAKELAAGA
jgi:pyrroline-5-carboxylate reductase